MAEGLLAAALPFIQVRSAGLGALVGMPADEMAVRLLREREIDISGHRAKQLTREMCDGSDLVLVMEQAQRTRVERLYPQARGRVFRIAEFLRKDVPDPYRQVEHVFRNALHLIDDGVQEWLHRIHRL
jgi:protein-tyrosine phosphatase